MSVAIRICLAALALFSFGPAASAQPDPGGDGAEYRADPPRERWRHRRDFRGPMREGVGPARSQQRQERLRRLEERMRDASPAQRRHIRRRLRTKMRFLSPEERWILRGEMRAIRLEAEVASSESPEGSRPEGQKRARRITDREQRRLLRERIELLPAEERRALWRKIRETGALPAEERQKLRERLEEIEALDEDERREIGEKARRWRTMSSETRERLREAREYLMSLPAEERLRVLDRVMDERTKESEDPSG